MRKLLSVLLAAIALFLAIAVVKGAVSLPNAQKRLRRAGFVNDGELHPEYEGRLVIVSDDLTSDSNARDEELGITLPSPCAIRYVEVLTEQTDAEGNPRLVWEPVGRDDNDRLREKMLADNLLIGAYRVDDALLEALSPGREVSLRLLDSGEVRALGDRGFYTVERGGVTYFSEAPFSSFDQKTADTTYAGARRIHYRMIDPDTGLRCCIAGISVNGTLLRDETLDTRPVFDGALTRGDVLNQNIFSTTIGMIITLILCLALLYYAARNFF